MNLKKYYARVIGDVERKITHDQYPEWENLLISCHRVYIQRRNDSNQLCSFLAPKVDCIRKGKVHKKYEIGCKVCVVSTLRDNGVL